MQQTNAFVKNNGCIHSNEQNDRMLLELVNSGKEFY